MRVIFNEGKLKSLVKDFSALMATKKSIPVCDHLKIAVAKNTAEITGTNLNVTVIKTLECDSDEKFTFLIDYATLTNIVNIADSPIVIDYEKESITVSTGLNDIYQIGQPEELKFFPKNPEYGKLHFFDAEEAFFKAIVKAGKCTSDSELMATSSVYVGLFRNDSGAYIDIVGMDGMCLYKERLAAQFDELPEKYEALIPKGTFSNFAAFKKGQFAISDRFFVAKNDDTMLIVGKTDLRYVAYNSVLPKNIEYNCQLPLSQINNALKKANVFKTFEKTGIINILSFSEDKITFKYEGEASAKSQVELQAEHQIGIDKIGIFYNEFTKLSSAFPDAENIDIAITDPKKPIFLRDAANHDITALLMPCMTA